MVSVPVTTRREVQVQPLGRERLRYSAPRNMIGPAIEDLGRSLGKAAQDWDEIEATYDEADALRLANQQAQYERERLRTGEGAYLNSQGFNAGEGMEAAVTDIKTSAENLLTGARSERARNMAKRALDTRLANAETEIARHATSQMTVARREQSKSRIGGAVEDAIGASGTDQFTFHLGTATLELGTMLAREGADQDTIKLETDRLTSKVMAGVLDRKWADPNADPEEIAGFIEANRELMDAPTYTNALKDLKAPLQERADYALYIDIVSGVPSEGATGGQATPAQGDPGIVGQELARAKFSPAVVAGFLGNFEVEGGYGGAQGDGGTASGIAQWRGDRRANFRKQIGKEPHAATPAEQARFVVWEMENPEKAGMTRAQRDAIMAAQTPSEAAELIDKHYERSSGQHRDKRKRAAERYSGTDNGPRRHDKAAIYDAIEARGDLTFEQKERVKKIADREIARDENLLSRQYQQAEREAAAIIGNLGDGFTSINQIPRAIRDKMDPIKIVDLEKDIRTRAEAAAKEGEKDRQTAAFTKLKIMKRFEPEKFKEANLTEYVGVLSPSQYTAAWSDQQTMLREPPKPYQPQGAISEAINRGKTFHGVAVSDGDKPALYDFMEDYMKSAFAKNGRIGPNDADEAFKAATSAGVVKTSSFMGFEVGRGEVPAFKVGYDDVPVDFRNAFVNGWRGSGKPSKQDVIDAWQRSRAR